MQTGTRRATAPPIRGLLFDKDGTLFGFQATWGGWTCDLVRSFAPGAPETQADLARRLMVDMAERKFLASSPVIAGTTDDVVALMLPALPGWTEAYLRRRLAEASQTISPVEAVPLGPLLARFRAAGLAIGVATNDAEEPARAQLETVGIGDAFDFVAGADSGHGAKPGPGMCLAFAKATGLSAASIAMVGDSTHDLRAGGAAGMHRVAVLTGVAEEAELAAHADVVLPDIGHLPEWLSI